MSKNYLESLKSLIGNEYSDMVELNSSILNSLETKNSINIIESDNHLKTRWITIENEYVQFYVKYEEIENGLKIVDIELLKLADKRLFVGGYFDDRIFEGEEFYGKTSFDKSIDTYTFSEVLELGFVENVVEWFEEQEEKEWTEADEDEKIKATMDYTESDEIAGLVYFSTEEEAEKYKIEVLKEIEKTEQSVIYQGKRQDQYGNYREVYIVK